MLLRDVYDRVRFGDWVLVPQGAVARCLWLCALWNLGAGAVARRCPFFLLFGSLQAFVDDAR